MQFHTTLTLPAIRAAQLRQVASKRGATSLELVDAFIRASWDDVIGDRSLPGFDLTAGLDDETGTPTVYFNNTGTQPVFLTVEQAHAVADGINELVHGRATRFEVDAAYESYRARFVGTKKGRGFILQVEDDVADASREPIMVHGLTTSIAEDLAESFRHYATAAEALAAEPLTRGQ
ncbi:hypothetical protein [Methylobacterium sp. B4]|uniref:hypothetical protein n=1 Tax=Methylobacterium sp. B4 TaxID=1938755 RepID=UPI000D770DFB|nr:hypothetical protein [Methylobacterium sp. B4]PXW57728.1 hypothetical protein BY998_1135 [Methylobacterium sp. B4]